MTALPWEPAKSFCDFAAQYWTHNWVLHRRTGRIADRYGENVRCVSKKEYAEMERQYRLAHGFQFVITSTGGNLCFEQTFVCSIATARKELGEEIANLLNAKYLH
jgi:hypothetical protein